MARNEPPGHRPGVVIAIGVPKGRGVPPGQNGAPDQNGQGMKATKEEAGGFDDDQRCRNCVHWHPDSGECDKVEGDWQPDFGCVQFFQPQVAQPDQDEDQTPETNRGSDTTAPLYSQ